MTVAAKTRKLSFPFPAALADRLHEASRCSGVPAAVLVRRAVRRYLDDAQAMLATLAEHPELLERATPIETMVLAYETGGTVPRAVERMLAGGGS